MCRVGFLTNFLLNTPSRILLRKLLEKRLIRLAVIPHRERGVSLTNLCLIGCVLCVVFFYSLSGTKQPFGKKVVFPSGARSGESSQVLFPAFQMSTFEIWNKVADSLVHHEDRVYEVTPVRKPRPQNAMKARERDNVSAILHGAGDVSQTMHPSDLR